LGAYDKTGQICVGAWHDVWFRVVYLLAPGGEAVFAVQYNAAFAAFPSGAADQDSGGEDQHSSQAYLQGCRERRRVHVMVADPGDDGQFDEDYDHRRRHGYPELRNQEGERVADPAQSGHQAADQAADPRVTATGETAVV